MTFERQGLFTELNPPPGGAARFAERLDVSSAPRRWLRPAPLALAGTAFAAIVAIAVLVWPTARDDSASLMSAAPVDVYSAPEFDRLLGRVSTPAELTVTRDSAAASVTQIETENAKVRIYRIDSPR